MNFSEIVKNIQSFGFCIEQNVIPKEECKIAGDVLDEIEEKQEIAQITDSQIIIDNLHIKRPDIFLDKINIPIVMETMSSIFQDTFILSSFNASRSVPSDGGMPHIDQRIPTRDFSNTFMMGTMFCIDDFSSTNGGTIYWPFSHLSGNDVPDGIKKSSEIPRGINVEAPSGSIIFFASQIWHAVSPKLSDVRRWGIVSSYSRWWVKPQYDFVHCGEDIFNRLTPEQKILFGFTTRIPFTWEKRRYTKSQIEELPNNYNNIIINPNNSKNSWSKNTLK